MKKYSPSRPVITVSMDRKRKQNKREEDAAALRSLTADVVKKIPVRLDSKTIVYISSESERETVLEHYRLLHQQKFNSFKKYIRKQTHPQS